MNRLVPLLMALTIPTVACAQAPARPADAVVNAANSITPADIGHRIGIIAHDSMGGRDTPSEGLEKTAAYIASEFRRFGLGPGGDDDSFIQRFSISQQRPNLAASYVRVSGGPTWKMGPDVLLLRGTVPSPITASTVIINTDDGGGIDDISVDGTIVLLAGSPTSFPDVITKLRDKNVAAIVQVTAGSERRWDIMRRRLEGSRWTKGWADFSGAPILEIRRTTIAPILEQYGIDLRGRRVAAREIPTLRLTIASDVSRNDATAPNVVGILEGSDPDLKNEYIVFSGHMDHVGIGRPVNGDSIYNGADDDASGTAAILELAEAYASLDVPPKRSMIFLTVSGEEKGMWGSEYFSLNSPVPMSQVVANLNTDMIGRNWRDTIVVIGKEHSDLGTTLNRVNARHPELNMTAIDDIWPNERFYFRSDHINFARNGVPILFFFSGTHEDYHRPSDHVDLIDTEKESRIVKLVFYLGLEIAQAAERPKWDPESYKRIVVTGN